MSTIDVCRMLNCFFFEKFYLHYALCDFDSILWHCTKLLIRQSIDRGQILMSFLKSPLPLKNPACAPDCVPIRIMTLFVCKFLMFEVMIFFCTLMTNTTFFLLKITKTWRIHAPKKSYDSLQNHI